MENGTELEQSKGVAAQPMCSQDEEREPSTTSVVRLEKVEKSYGSHKVLTDVNLDIHKGDIFGLVGKNGAGKTTIFKVMLGLSGYESGSVFVGDKGDDLEKGRRKVGFLIGCNFFSYMTGRQNLEYYRVLKGIKDKGEVDRVLQLVGLDQAKGKFGRYSLGMKQRLGIANALMGNPEILVLDEPTNGLDPQGIADIRELVQRLNREYGMTVIISSHILGELQHTADRFGILQDGRVARTISQEDLISDQKSVRIKVSDLEAAKKALEAAGIEILGSQTESLSLEEFYFDIVGSGHAEGQDAEELIHGTDQERDPKGTMVPGGVSDEMSGAEMDRSTEKKEAAQ